MSSKSSLTERPSRAVTVFLIRVNLNGRKPEPFLGIQDLIPAWLYEPGKATSHTLTAQVTDNCRGAAHFTVDSISVDVIGIK